MDPDLVEPPMVDPNLVEAPPRGGSIPEASVDSPNALVVLQAAFSADPPKAVLEHFFENNYQNQNVRNQFSENNSKNIFNRSEMFPVARVSPLRSFCRRARASVRTESLC